MAKQNLGMVTAYAYAVVGGYDGTEAEFEALLGNIATDLAEIENLTVIANTLPPGSSATASYDHGVLTLGIPKGDKGDTGAGATVTAGTTATGNPGTNASVTNSGTTKDAVFNFTIPRGDTGNGIESIYLTATHGAVKTYTILFTDGNTTTFDVTDGEVTNAQLTAAVTDLKEDFNSTMTSSSIQTLFEIGGIDAGTGEDFDASNRLRTSKFDSNIKQIIAANGYLFLVYAYNGSTFVGTWDGASFIPTGTTYVNTFNFDLSLSYQYRIAVKRTDNENISIAESANITFVVPTDKSLSQNYKSADAKVTGDSIRSIMTALASISADGRISTFKLDDISSFTAGKAINGSGVVINEGKSYCTEYYIDVTAGMRVSAQLSLVTHTSFYQYVAFYDSTHTFMSRVGGDRKYIIDEDVPTNAKYCRITLSYVNTTAQPANVSSFAFTVYYPLNVVTTSPKNKWYVLGDSISAGYYSLMTADVPSGVTPAVSYEDGTCSIWDATLEHNYWGYANKWFLNRELIGKAYPAQGYLHTASNSQNGIYVVKNNSFSDAGLITVAWGFNDWHYNMARGDHSLIDESVPYPTDNYDTTQLTTINHAIWYCLGELIRKAPKAKIVVQTPINGWRYGGDFSTNWGIGYSMTQSDTLKDVHDDIIYWCDYYGLQCIDMTFNNSVVNRLNIKDTIIDGSHPSDEAHKQLARSVWTMLGY